MKHIHTQAVPSSTWTITIPQTGSKAFPIAAYTPAGNSITFDSWLYRNNTLIIDFGIDDQFGELLYEYTNNGDVDTVLTRIIPFANKRYIEVDVLRGSDVQVYEILHSNNPEVHRKVTEGVSVTIRDDKAIIEASKNITGYILIK